MTTLTFLQTPESFINNIESIGIKVQYLSSIDKVKHNMLINTKKCIVSFGLTFIGVFKDDGKIQLSYTSAKNTSDIILNKFEKLVGISSSIQPVAIDKTKPIIKEVESVQSINVGDDKFIVDYTDHNWGMMKELKHLGCEFDSKNHKFVCPISKKPNISEVLNHYLSNSKGLTSSQRDKRDKLINLLPLDCEIKKDEKGLWIININYLAEKKQIQEACKSAGFKYVRSVNGVRHLIK
jgi:hypothetical protein